MTHSTRILRIGTLATAVVAVLSAFAFDYLPGATPLPGTGLSTVVATAAVPPPPTVVSSLSLTSPEQSGFDRFIVKYQDGVAAQRSTTTLLDAVNIAATRAGVATIKTTAGGAGRVLSLQYLRRLATGADLIQLSRQLDRTETEALLSQLRADPMVKYAQPDFISQRADFTPNDPKLNLQWHYTDPRAGIGAPAAWEKSSGQGVVVAVIDTGYVDHSDLNANLVPGYDFISDVKKAGDGDGRDADAHDVGDWIGSEKSSFHGTHVAGTVGAVTNNGISVAGVAFGAKVQPVRVLGRGGGVSSDIADAIVWASGGTVAGVPKNPNPAEVINLSLGGKRTCSQDPVTQEAIDGAVSRGVTVVVAAGNYNEDAAFYTPASCKGVIVVGANGIDGGRSYFSNFGAAVTVTAPGGSATSGSDPADRWIWSLGNRGEKAPIPGPEGEALTGMIGTSMASPHVAGVVALMQSAAVAAKRPPLTPAQIKTLLRNTVKPFTITPPQGKSQGPGIVNATAAVLAATQGLPKDDGQLLTNRLAMNGQSGAAGEVKLYKLVVPAGSVSLNLRTYGGIGNVSIYVAYQRLPSAIASDYKSAKPGNSEAVVITSPTAGTYYLAVVGETSFSNLSVMGLY